MIDFHFKKSASSSFKSNFSFCFVDLVETALISSFSRIPLKLNEVFEAKNKQLADISW